MERELDRAGLDRYITGNWGEDQFRDDEPEEDEEPEGTTKPCGCPGDLPPGVHSDRHCKAGKKARR